MRLKITVTKNDIRSGRRSHTEQCPIGKAVNRALKPYKLEASIDTTDILLSTQKEWSLFSIKAPTRVISFVKKFDNYDVPRSKFEPFDFYLNIPKELLSKS